MRESLAHSFFHGAKASNSARVWTLKVKLRLKFVITNGGIELNIASSKIEMFSITPT